MLLDPQTAELFQRLEATNRQKSEAAYQQPYMAGAPNE
jgi:hypothetical protein